MFSPRHALFARLLWKSMAGRGARAATALAAITLAAAITTTLGSLQASLGARLSAELQAFGPNILVQSPPGQTLQWRPIQAAAAAAHATADPYRDVLASINGRVVVVRGVDFTSKRRLSEWWHVAGAWPTRSGEVLAGSDLSARLHAGPGSVLTIAFPGHGASRQVVSGTLTSGGEEDSQIVAPLRILWDETAPDTVTGVQVRAAGSAAAVEATALALRKAEPSASVHVLQRVARADTIILQRLEEVFGLLGLAIVLGAGLCVSTLFATMVQQRSAEIGLQKALGATDTQVVSFFWGEALCLGSAGTLVGYLLGCGFAMWIGAAVFHAAAAPQLLALPGAAAVAIGMTLIAAVPSARRIARLDPAVSLKGSASGSKR